MDQDENRVKDITGPHSEAALLLVANRKPKEEARMNASDFAAIVKDAGVRLVVLGVLLRQTSSLIPDADMAGARDALERCVERKKPEH